MALVATRLHRATSRTAKCHYGRGNMLKAPETAKQGPNEQPSAPKVLR
jgi:hypothetical protein